MTVMNQLDRFNLAMDVIDRVARLQATSGAAREELKNKLIEHKIYIQIPRRGHAGDPQLAMGPRTGPGGHDRRPHAQPPEG